MDDDPDIRVALTEVLEMEGFHVLTASDGIEALARLRRGFRPSAILLDLMMPRMDGWAFRAEQRKDPQLARIPTVLLTASGLCEQARADLEARECLAKPLTLEGVLEALRRCQRPVC